MRTFFNHTFYFLYILPPLCWLWAVVWLLLGGVVCFSYFSFLVVILKYIFFYILLFNFAFSFFFSFIFFPPCLFVCFAFFALFLSWHFALDLFSVLVSFVSNWLISLLVSFASQATVLYFVFFGLFWFCLCVYVCGGVCYFVIVTIYLVLHLPFVWSSFFVSCFSCFCGLVLISFITITTVCGIFLPQSETGPDSLGWERWVQDTGLPENSSPQGVLLISENFHQGLHLYPRPGSTQLPAAPSTEYLTQVTSKTRSQINHQQTGFPKKLQNTTSYSLTRKREKNSPFSTIMQAQVPTNTKPTQTTGPKSPTEDRN